VYVDQYTVVRSYNHCCDVNTIISSPFLIIGAAVTVSSLKVFGVFVEMHQWLPFALLWRYRIFGTAVNNKH